MKRLELDAWLAALLNADEVERARAATALGAMGRHGYMAVGALIRTVEIDDEWCVRQAAARALLAIQRDGVNLAPALASLMFSEAAGAHIWRAWLREQLEARAPALFRR